MKKTVWGTETLFDNTRTAQARRRLCQVRSVTDKRMKLTFKLYAIRIIVNVKVMNSNYLSADYEGRWKLAHYFAARFFADPMLSVIREQSNVAIYTVSDSLSPVDDVTLVIQVWTWSGASPLLHKSSNILIVSLMA